MSAARITLPMPTGLERQGLRIALKTPAEMPTMLPGEIAKWAAVIKSAQMAQE